MVSCFAVPLIVFTNAQDFHLQLSQSLNLFKMLTALVEV